MSIKDVLCGDGWNGITNTSTVTWHTDPGPTAEATPVDIENPIIELTFDRPIAANTGTIQILDGNGDVVKELQSDDPAVIYS